MKIAIVVAAGKSERMKAKQNKLFLSLAGKPLLVWTLKAISGSIIDSIIVVVQEKDINRTADLVNEYSIPKISKIILGGPKRQDSVSNAFNYFEKDVKIVAIHDGARPLADSNFINKTIKELWEADGVVPALMPVDTIKRKRDDYVEETLNRPDLIAVQTPQIFKKEALLDSYRKAKEEGFYGSDDASLLERYGYKVKIAKGAYDNIKITRPSDLAFAEVLIKSKKGQ
ncbi:MAG: 2-C-methyl-D-erythritol 4-phosphate cytidylyltransferase [Actinobacteria bacterium]|nr:MAG: 2-C-methyl-D-erythritol 4-phosphate cytidylyltransferase [Actinomycetota bacterium]